MFDLDAPIIPGTSAAGPRLGQAVDSLLARETPWAVVTLSADSVKYQFDALALWVTQGRIDQIGLYKGYRGRLEHGVGIGSTLAEVRAAFGVIAEDADDNLVVQGQTGWCFETEEWLAGRKPEDNPTARVAEIFVFAETGNQGTAHNPGAA